MDDYIENIQNKNFGLSAMPVNEILNEDESSLFVPLFDLKPEIISNVNKYQGVILSRFNLPKIQVFDIKKFKFLIQRN